VTKAKKDVSPHVAGDASAASTRTYAGAPHDRETVTRQSRAVAQGKAISTTLPSWRSQGHRPLQARSHALWMTRASGTRHSVKALAHAQDTPDTFETPPSNQATAVRARLQAQFFRAVPFHRQKHR
jgi:hypothetical protein